jgi:hypothetical protein
MLDRSLQHKLSHLFVRIVATTNLVNSGLAALHLRYFRGLERQHLDKIIVIEGIASSLMLPLVVGFEAWWMRKSELERKPILIDAVFALVWLLVLWIGVLYAFGHYAMF